MRWEKYPQSQEQIEAHWRMRIMGAELLDTEAAAYMLNSSRRHVQNLVAKGLIPNRGEPYAIRLDWRDIDQAITDGRIKVLEKK